ncbi:MAG: peptidoglycan-binding protein [Massilia sp.]|nr:peptidoglycan-binding protein [Massilia sp.]
MTTVFEGATSVLGIAGSITTLIALAALSLLIAYLLATQWLRDKGDAAKAAIAKGDDSMLARLLGGSAIPLDKLSSDQKYALAAEELRTRARQRTIAYTLIFFGFLALLGFALALVLAPKRGEEESNARKPVQLDLLAALNVLRYVPVAERPQLCLTLMAKDDCERAAAMIAGLTFQMPTAKQGEAIEQAVATGHINIAQANQLAACGGKFEFKVVNNMLVCADGTTLPTIAISDGSRLMETQSAIVLHATVTGKNSPFATVADFLANGRPNLPGPLAHLLISTNGAIAQTAPMNHVASHVGISAPWHGIKITNSNAIGVELIHTGNYQEDPYPEIQLQATIAVVKALMQAYGISTIVGHNEIAAPAGRKADPGPGVAADIRRRLGLAEG